MKRAKSLLIVATCFSTLSLVAFSNPRETKSSYNGLAGKSEMVNSDQQNRQQEQRVMIPLDNSMIMSYVPKTKNHKKSNIITLNMNGSFYKSPVDSVIKRESTNEFENSLRLPVPDADTKTGLSFGQKIKYPEKAIDDGISGLVQVICTIEPSGKPSHIKVLQDIGDDCATSVINALKNTMFQPAQQNGTAIRCTVRIPVLFELIQP